jgi:hypothetical protein
LIFDFPGSVRLKVVGLLAVQVNRLESGLSRGEETDVSSY